MPTYRSSSAGELSVAREGSSSFDSRPPAGTRVGHGHVLVDGPVAPIDPLDTGTTVIKPAPDGATWTPADVAAYLQVSERHLRTVRGSDFSLPAPWFVGRSPRWMPRTIEGWLTGRDDQQPGAVHCGEASWTLTDVAAHIEKSTRQLQRVREADPSSPTRGWSGVRSAGTPTSFVDGRHPHPRG